MLIKLTKKLLKPLASYLESVWSNLTFYLQTTLKSQTLWSFLAFQIVHKFLAKSNTRHKWSILYLLRCHLHQSFLMLSFLSPQLLPFKVWVGRVPQTLLWGFTKKSRPIILPHFFAESYCFTHYVPHVASYWKPKPISIGVQHTILRLFPIVLDEKGAADWNHLVQFISAWSIMSQCHSCDFIVCRFFADSFACLFFADLFSMFRNCWRTT